MFKSSRACFISLKEDGEVLKVCETLDEHAREQA